MERLPFNDEDSSLEKLGNQGPTGPEINRRDEAMFEYDPPKYSNEGECDECQHPADGHDLNTGNGGQPCTLDGCECADYYCHVDSMMSLGDALYHRAKEETSPEYENFRAEERRL
jgi:hypothetical protein